MSELDKAPFGSNPAPEAIGERRGMFGAHGSGDTSGFGGLRQPITFAQGASRPFGSWYDDAVDYLSEVLGERGYDPVEVIEKVVVDRAELTLFIERSFIVPVVSILRDDPDLRFEMCFGVSGVHYPQQEGREFHAVYHLMSITHNRQLRLEVTCPEDDPTVPSVVDVYPGNDWHERETWDLMGIEFTGHPSLARIAMPDDWVGHPQRKDYPLGGVPIQYKGATTPPVDDRRHYN